MEIRSFPQPERAAAEAAAEIGVRLQAALSSSPRAAIALSGGSTAPLLIESLAALGIEWDRVGVWQVDERIAPDGHESRNANQLTSMPGELHLMPVAGELEDLSLAAQRHAASLPERFDIVHLGLGADGHTASWPPDQPAVVNDPSAVTITDAFNGFRRMTLTPRAINAARGRIVLAVGASKAPMVSGWLRNDPRLPITKVLSDDTLVYLDQEATPPEAFAG